MKDQLSIQNILFTILVGISSFGVWFLRDLSVNVAELNSNMVKVITKLSHHEEKINKNSSKIEKIENRFLK